MFEWLTKIINWFMRRQISSHIKREYFNKGITPTTEQVMADIPAEKMVVLLNNGYTREDIEKTVRDVIRRHK